MSLLYRLRQLINSNQQLVYYAIIGLSGATLDFIIYLLLYQNFGIPPFIASFLSVSAGIINNFILNARYNFKKSDSILLRLLSFYLVGLAGALLSVGLILILNNILSVNPTLAKLLTIPPVVLIQFMINKKVSFNDSPHNVLSKLLDLLLYTYRPYLIVITSALFFFSAIYFAPGHDEMDNMLGGRLMWDGQIPYSNFFSHHAPGMYYLAAIIYPFVSNDIFLYRLAHNMIVFGLMLVIYWQLHRRVSQQTADYYLLLSSLSNVVAFGYMALAESLISQLFILAFILVFLRKSNNLPIRHYLALSAILFCIPLMSLGYIFLSFIIYATLGWLLIRELWTDYKSYRPTLVKSIILTLPYILYGGYIFFSGAWSDLYYDLFIYNSQIYASFAHEVGGGILNTLKHSVLSSYDQITTVLLNPGGHFAQWLLLSSFAYLAYYLWTKGRRLEAILIVPILLLLNNRVNIFNPPAITSNFFETKQHGDMYISMAIFALAVGSVTFLQNKPKRWQWQSTAYIPILALLFVPLSVYGVWKSNMGDYLIGPQKTNYQQISRQVKQSNSATPINIVANVQDSAWIGPADFRSQLYLKPKRATYFTFFQPHIAASEVFLERFTSELLHQKPLAIYWKTPNIPPQIQEILSWDYFQVTDTRLTDYYFLTSQRSTIIERLAQHGYQIN